MDRVERFANRAIRRRRFAEGLRGRKLVQGPWWRNQIFDPLRLAAAKDNGRTCVVCDSREITGCWGAMWSDPVAWGCAECRERHNSIVTAYEPDPRGRVRAVQGDSRSLFVKAR